MSEPKDLFITLAHQLERICEEMHDKGIAVVVLLREPATGRAATATNLTDESTREVLQNTLLLDPKLSVYERKRGEA